MSVFGLDSRLKVDTLQVCDLGLCSVRLMNDSRFIWLILVPRVVGAVELTDLSPSQAHDLTDEVLASSRALMAVARPHKLNTGALGNIVRQLHVHVVARKPGDAAWPGPVWGSGPAQRYDEKERERLVGALRQQFVQLPQKPA